MTEPMMSKNELIHTAEYTEQPISDYRGNPFIEALPSLISQNEVIKQLTYYPTYNSEERNFDSHLRLHILQRIFQCFQPLPMTLDLESRISRTIRQGYISRNINSSQLARGYHNDFMAINKTNYSAEVFNHSAVGFSLIGISGLGKTASLQRILQLYPQVICHSEYKGSPLSCQQVVWLKLECPFDGSIKGLAYDFFASVDGLLGTNYHKRMFNARPTTDMLISVMNQIARNTSLGLLVIDEIQNLSLAKSGGSEKMLSFLVNIINGVGLPVILVGTPKGMGILQSEFRQARRGSGVGGDFIIGKMKNDDSWSLLVRTIWRYQWTKKETPISQELIDTLYEETQGIPDLLLKAYAIVQGIAINTEKEEITTSLIRQIFSNHLKLVKPYLEALKTNDMRKLAKFSDINISNIDVSSLIYARPTIDLSSVQLHRSETSPKASACELVPLTKKETNKKEKVEMEKNPDDIRFIVKKIEGNGKTAYEALLGNGYIKSTTKDEILR